MNSVLKDAQSICQFLKELGYDSNLYIVFNIGEASKVLEHVKTGDVVFIDNIGKAFTICKGE